MLIIQFSYMAGILNFVHGVCEIGGGIITSITGIIWMAWNSTYGSLKYFGDYRCRLCSTDTPTLQHTNIKKLDSTRLGYVLNNIYVFIYQNKYERL